MSLERVAAVTAPAPSATPTPAPDTSQAMRLQILSSEHASLTATRSLA